MTTCLAVSFWQYTTRNMEDHLYNWMAGYVDHRILALPRAEKIRQCEWALNHYKITVGRVMEQINEWSPSPPINVNGRYYHPEVALYVFYAQYYERLLADAMAQS